MKAQFYKKSESTEILRLLVKHREQYLYQINPNKNSITIHDQNELKLGEFILPLDYRPLKDSANLEEYLELEQSQKCLYILMQAGSAALAYHDGQKISLHKMIKKYMVRKGQGKAQITHLETKGKSRYGSRLRLQESERFFFEIGDKILEWEILEETDKILFNAPTKLWSLLFEKRFECPFPKDDPRLQSIPYYTDTPNFNEI